MKKILIGIKLLILLVGPFVIFCEVTGLGTYRMCRAIVASIQLRQVEPANLTDGKSFLRKSDEQQISIVTNALIRDYQDFHGFPSIVELAKADTWDDQNKENFLVVHNYVHHALVRLFKKDGDMPFEEAMGIFDPYIRAGFECLSSGIDHSSFPKWQKFMYTKPHKPKPTDSPWETRHWEKLADRTLEEIISVR